MREPAVGQATAAGGLPSVVGGPPAAAAKALSAADALGDSSDPALPGAAAGRDEPGPVAEELLLVEGEPEGAPELVVREVAVSLVVEAGEEPAAVLGVDKVPLGRAGVVLPGDGGDLGAAVARGRLGRPHAHLPTVVEHEAFRTTILEDGVVIFVLVEFDAAVEPVKRYD